ncbi:MAG: hypothetical protein NTW50_04935, partial [Candidatus Berkelbacteria bacterium]|nr:hypothetical protein [Candidatus Berkelbacteria bacterium]
ANLGANITVAEENDTDPRIYGHLEFGGVHKSTGQLFAESNSSLPNHSEMYQPRGSMALARVKVMEIADRLTRKLEQMPVKKQGNFFNFFKH